MAITTIKTVFVYFCFGVFENPLNYECCQIKVN